ncbi:MAG: HAD-IA family hydrolase [Myxococcaceae bacterium]
MTVRAACFDLLSALLDSWAVWDAVAAELGSPGLGRPWRRRYLALTSTAGTYRPYLDVVEQSAREVGLPSIAAGALEQRWPGLSPWPEVVPALSALALPLAVVTNCSEVLGRTAAARVGLSLATVVTAEAAGAYKPDPAPYRLACERLGHAPSQVAYVAGSPFDAEGALAHGFQVTWVNRLGDAVPPSLTGVRVIGSLAGWTPDPG